MTETGARRGAGWWPQLVLWGTVIAVGALYLASVERHRGEALTQAGHKAGPQVGAAPVPVVAPPGAMDTAPVAGATPAAAHSGPGQTQGGAVELGPATEPEPPVRPSALRASTAPDSAATPPVDPTAAKADSAQVAAAEARAFAEAVTEAQPIAQVTATNPPPGVAGAPFSAPAGGAVPRSATQMPISQPPATQPSAAAAAPSAARAREVERARILAEYEALSRAHEQELTPRWGGRLPQRGYGPWPYGTGPERPGQVPGAYPAYPGR
jgi:hypothetical protein